MYCLHAGAKVKVFDHNDPAHLEAVLRSAIAEGQPRTGRPWKKIVSWIERAGWHVGVLLAA